jgi:aromatic ring-opening dioxygenase catalytic subunit (LigB family)
MYGFPDELKGEVLKKLLRLVLALIIGEKKAMSWMEMVSSILTPTGIAVIIFQSGKVMHRMKTLASRMDKFDQRMDRFEERLTDVTSSVTKIKERLKRQ